VWDKLQNPENLHKLKDLDHLAHVLNVLSLFFLSVYHQHDTERNKEDEVNYIQKVFPEFVLTGSSNQDDGKLPSEPSDAHNLYTL
jgi:hypothetical protein